MFDIIHGLEYYIELDKIYDYYDIIPDLEKTFRHRFAITNRDDRSVITVINYNVTLERYTKTEHYKSRVLSQHNMPQNYEDHMQNYEEHMQKLKDDTIYRQQLSSNLPITLAESEIELISNVKIKLESKYVKGYWDTYYGII